MRLHNRQIKASFWSDPDLLMWPRDKRWFYEGLIQLADDSGCLEDSPLAFKIALFPSPTDADITLEVLTQWRNELVEAGKLVPYEAQGKACLFLANFHKHQALKNPAPPEVPLPAWVKWEPYKSNPRAGKYIISSPHGDLQPSYEVLTPVLQTSSNQNQNQNLIEPEPEGEGEGGLGGTQTNSPSGQKPDSPSGGNTNTDQSQPEIGDISPQERLLLDQLKAVPGYPFDQTKDIGFVRALASDFPDINLLDEAKRWGTRVLDKPFKPNANPRLQFRHWLEIAVKRRRSQGKSWSISPSPVRQEGGQPDAGTTGRNSQHAGFTAEDYIRSYREAGWDIDISSVISGH